MPSVHTRFDRPYKKFIYLAYAKITERHLAEYFKSLWYPCQPEKGSEEEDMGVVHHTLNSPISEPAPSWRGRSKRDAALHTATTIANSDSDGNTVAENELATALLVEAKAHENLKQAVKQFADVMGPLDAAAQKGPWEADIDDPHVEHADAPGGGVWTGKFYTGGAHSVATGTWCTYNDEFYTIPNAKFTAAARGATTALLIAIKE